jgi:hypothetical protein
MNYGAGADTRPASRGLKTASAKKKKPASGGLAATISEEPPKVLSAMSVAIGDPVWKLRFITTDTSSLFVVKVCFAAL